MTQLLSLNQSIAQMHFWVFGVVLVLLITLAFTRLFYAHFITDRISAYTAGRYLKQLIRKELVLYHPYSIITLVLFSLAVGLVGLKFSQIFQLMDLFNRPDYLVFIIITGITLAWIIGRALIFKIIQVFIGYDFGQTENRYRIIVFNQVCAYMLIPVVSVLFFVRSPLDYWLLLFCIAILVLNYCYRVVQSLITAVNYSVNLLYLFLYLCTLEIVPILLLISYLMHRSLL